MKSFLIAALSCLLYLIGMVHAETDKSDETFIPNTISDIAGDDDYLWLASDEGLVKFNKTTMERTYYTEENSDIPLDNTRSVSIVDSDVWVGTEFAGIGIFDGASWDSLTTSNSSLPSNVSIRDILVTEDDGIWIAAAGWACRLKDEIWTSFQFFDGGQNDWITSIAQDQYGTIWVGTSDGLYTISDNQVDEFNALPQTPYKNAVFQMIAFPDSTMWGGFPEQGIYNITEHTVVPYTHENSGIPQEAFGPIAFDTLGRLWAGGQNTLLLFDSGNWHTYDSDDCTSLQNIKCIYCDTNNVIWIGTFENGLIRFNGESWTQYDIIPDVTAVENETDTPTAIELNPAYPNPFNPQTTISYTLPEAAHINLTVYSIIGQQVAVLVDEYTRAGTHSAVFESDGLASGVYFYQLESSDMVKTGRMALVK